MKHTSIDTHCTPTEQQQVKINITQTQTVNKYQADNVASKIIIETIQQAERECRERYSVLKHQNAIGFGVLCFALFGMILSGIGYIVGLLPAWLAICLSAVFAGISHEIEHDLIHKLYFRRHKLMNNIMMTIVWLMRPNTVNPWYRRQMHFNHHKTSGTEQDLEERILGNGMKFGFFRLFISLDTFFSITLRAKELSKLPQFNYFAFILKGAPLAHVYLVSLYSFLLFHLYDVIAPFAGLSVQYSTLLLTIVDALNIMAVVWLLPNALRAISLHGISATLHYYGNVQHINQQCQVLNHWLLTPVQLFCCNFGSTHIIHHYVVQQPFYIRQLIAKKVHKVMKAQGVRFNDYDSLMRGNRFKFYKHAP